MNIVHFVLSFKENTSGYGNGKDGWWQINYAHIQHVDSEWKLIILPTSHVAPIKPAAHVHVKKPRPSTHVPPFTHGLLRHVPVSISTLKQVSTFYMKNYRWWKRFQIKVYEIRMWVIIPCMARYALWLGIYWSNNSFNIFYTSQLWT